jgi:alanine racemase
VGLINVCDSVYDITDIPEIAWGDSVILLGRHAPQNITAEELAAWALTTPYEILTLLGRLNPRFIEGADL